MSEPASVRFENIETWPSSDMLATLWESQLGAAAAVRPALPAIEAAVVASAARLRHGGRLAYAGAGTSGRIGVQDGAELTPTFGWPRDRLLLLIAGGSEALLDAVENAEDRTDSARHDVAQLGPDDVLVALAASGATPYTVACIEAARTAGSLTIGLSNRPGSAVLAAAEHGILLDTGPEVIDGSTRMAAGTAQKIALNLFSTLLMARLGHIYRGRMIDMLARNDKLRRRAIGMVVDLSKASPGEAALALDRVAGSVKRAILVVHGMLPEQAEMALAAADGDLRIALTPLQ